MARQIRPGQLQENVLYNISASYAVTASYATNGPGVPSGTVSGSAQITELGFVTSSATSSFVTNSQTASMSVATASYVTSAQSSSYILAANIDQPFTTVSASGILNTGGDNFNIAGNGDDVVISTGTSAFVVESEAQFKDSVNIDLATNRQLIVSGGRVDLRNALGVSGSFSGSFEGDGSGLTNIPATGITGLNLSQIASGSATASISPNGGFNINTNITASGNVSSSAASTASFGTYLGDGSQLSGISSTPFPFVGDAVITGSLTITGSFNAFKLNANNVVLGPDAGTSLNAGGLNNVILGNSAASNLTTGDNNVIIGTNAGDGVGTGGSNVAIGRNAGFSALGNRSVLVGDQAGTQGGTDNVFLGYQAGAVGTGNYNVAIGTTALRGNSGGSEYNIAIGYEAGYGVGAGDENVLVGMNAGRSIVTGNANIIIGSGSLGASALERQLRIGHSDNIIISASLETGDVIFASTASAAYFVGDGSQLSGINSSTSLTQSLFVSPSGNDGTAIVGDLHSPFQTILAATASANLGDTIFIYPGTYNPSSQIIKEGVNYYPGAHISASLNTPIMNGTFEKVNVRGYGQFEGGGFYGTHGALINLDDVAKSSHLEFDFARTLFTTNNYQAVLRVGTANTTADIEHLKIKGDVEMTGSGGGSLVQALQLQAGNVWYEGRVHVDTATVGTQAIEINSDVADSWIKADAYSATGAALFSSARNPHVKFEGKYETGTQGSYYAIQINDGYQGQHIIDAEVVGSININPGPTNYGGVKFTGYQSCTDSPSNVGALYIQSGHNHIDATVYNSDAITFNIDGGYTLFNGLTEVANNGGTRIIDVSSGVLHWQGSNLDNNKRADSNVISGGTLLIDSFFEHYGGNYPNNEFAFNLSGGTLEINNKFAYHQQTTGSGIVNMSGGYLKLNGAQLIQSQGTGSFAYCVKLNEGSHSGSILNNSFTNLTPFGPGSFTNEITGGGTLFYSDKLY